MDFIARYYSNICITCMCRRVVEYCAMGFELWVTGRAAVVTVILMSDYENILVEYNKCLVFLYQPECQSVSVSFYSISAELLAIHAV